MDIHAESESFDPHFFEIPVDLVPNVPKTEAMMNERFDASSPEADRCQNAKLNREISLRGEILNLSGKKVVRFSSKKPLTSHHEVPKTEAMMNERFDANYFVTRPPPEARARGPPCPPVRYAVNSETQPSPTTGSQTRPRTDGRSGEMQRTVRNLSMRTKSVSVRLTSVEEVQASAQTFGSKVVDLLDERLGSPLDGVTGFSYQQVFDHLDSDLEAVRLGMVEAEDEHVRQQIVISKLQRESDRSKAALYDQQVGVRQVFTGLFGPEHGFELGAISGRTPTGRKDLEEQVDQTVKLLRDPAVEVPELKVKQGIEIDFGRLADGLETGKTELHSARSGLLLARKAGVQTLFAKRAAMAELDRVFPAAAGTLEGLFRLAGEVELADRIRTSIRRVTGRRPDEDDEVPTDDALSTDGESGDGASETAPSSAAASESPPSGSSEPEPVTLVASPPAEPALSEPDEPAVSTA